METEESVKAFQAYHEEGTTNRSSTEDDDDIRELDSNKNGTMYSAAFTLANGTIGAGLLGLPYLASSAGVVLGSILIIVFGLLTNCTLRLLHQVTLITGDISYENIGRTACGGWGALAVKVCVVGINFGAELSYIIILGDFLQPLAEGVFGQRDVFSDGTEEGSLLTNRTFIQLFVTVFILFPLSLSTRITSLRWISLVSLLVAYIFVAVVVVQCIRNKFEDPSGEGTVYAKLNFGTVQSFGIAVFAFAVHSNLVPVTAEMKDNSFPTVAKSINISNAICIVSFLTVAVFGYFTFYSTTDGNILNNYEDGSIVIDIVRALMALVIMFTFPLCMYPLRLSFDNLVFDTCRCRWGRQSFEKDGEVVGEDEQFCSLIQDNEVEDEWVVFYAPLPWKSLDGVWERYPVTNFLFRHVFETVLFCTISFVLASNIPDVEVVFSLTGGLFSSNTSYCFPGLFYFTMRHKDPQPSALKTYGSVACVVFGLFVCVITTGANIYDIVG